MALLANTAQKQAVTVCVNDPQAAAFQLCYTSPMKYLLAIALFLAAAMLPPVLKAQSASLNYGSAAPSTGSLPASLQDGGYYFRGFRGADRAVVFPPFFGYPSNYPFDHFYPGLWPPLDYEYQQASRIAHGDVAAEVAAQENAYLSSQVRALTDEVHSLRQQQAFRQYAQQPTTPSRAEGAEQPLPEAQSRVQQKFPATVFIYRDGREMEVRDYAIFGETLWVFQGDTTRKFPLRDFNLAASRQVNEEHGVEFPLSDPQKQ